MQLCYELLFCLVRTQLSFLKRRCDCPFSSDFWRPNLVIVGQRFHFKLQLLSCPRCLRRKRLLVVHTVWIFSGFFSTKKSYWWLNPLVSSTLPFHLKSTEDCKSDKAQNSEEFTKTAAPQIPQKKKMRKIVDEFNRYFGDGTLENWQRLCRDIGIEDDLPSVKQCRLVSLSYSLPPNLPCKNVRACI